MLTLLSEEAQTDAARSECFLPQAFAATTGQWWYSAPLNYWQELAKLPVPTPYS